MDSYRPRNSAFCSGVSCSYVLFNGMLDVQRSRFFSMVPVDAVFTLVNSVGASGMPCSFEAVCAWTAPQVNTGTATNIRSRPNFMAGLSSKRWLMSSPGVAFAQPREHIYSKRREDRDGQGSFDPGQRRLLLPGDAHRLGAVLPRQQGVAVLPAARHPRLLSIAGPGAVLVGLRAGCRQQPFRRHPTGALAAALRAAMRG